MYNTNRIQNIYSHANKPYTLQPYAFRYNVDAAVKAFSHWTQERGRGGDVRDWFDEQSRYIGPNVEGVEPIFVGPIDAERCPHVRDENDNYIASPYNYLYLT